MKPKTKKKDRAPNDNVTKAIVLAKALKTIEDAYYQMDAVFFNPQNCLALQDEIRDRICELLVAGRMEGLEKMKLLGGCDFIQKVLGIQNYCCSSCHWDAEEGFGYLMERESEDLQYWVQVCCAMAGSFDEYGLSLDPWPKLIASQESS